MRGPASVSIVNLFREPLFKMSNTRFEISDSTFVSEVCGLGDEAYVAGVIPRVVVNAVHFQRWVIPPRNCLNVLEEGSFIATPFTADSNSAPTIVLEMLRRF